MKQVFSILLIMCLVGCVQMPTKNTQVVDDRPGLSFALSTGSSASYELLVDGISYGAVGQYQKGQNALKLVDGTHRVELIHQGKVVLSEKVYLGAGVNKVLKVGVYEN